MEDEGAISWNGCGIDRDGDSTANLEMAVELDDGPGNAAVVQVTPTTVTSIPIPRQRRDEVNPNAAVVVYNDRLSKSMLKTVRIPLCQFKQAPGGAALDLSKIKNVVFIFYQQAGGAAGLFGACLSGPGLARCVPAAAQQPAVG